MNLNVLTDTPVPAATETTLGEFARGLPDVPDALSYTDLEEGSNHVVWVYKNEEEDEEFCLDLSNPSNGVEYLDDVYALAGSIKSLHLDITVVPLALAPQATEAIANAVAGLRGR